MLMTRECPIKQTFWLITHSTSYFHDRLQLYKIEYFWFFFWKNKLYLEIAYCAKSLLISSSSVTSKTKGLKGYLRRARLAPLQKWNREPLNKPRLPKENCSYTTSIINRSSVVQIDRWSILKIVTDSEHYSWLKYTLRLLDHKWLRWIDPYLMYYFPILQI